MHLTKFGAFPGFVERWEVFYAWCMDANLIMIMLMHCKNLVIFLKYSHVK